MNSDPQKFTLRALEAELAAHYAGLAMVADECYEKGAGSRMLGPADDGCEYITLDRVEAKVRATRIGRLLPVWYRYGVEGIHSAGYSSRDFDVSDGPLERLRDMVNLLRTSDPYFQDCLLTLGVEKESLERRGLSDLIERVGARVQLDTGAPLSLHELAVLAEMNERSVRNALSADGEGRLVAGPEGLVENTEAHRWLRDRRNFRPTQNRELPNDLLTVPIALDAAEIPQFVARRLELLSQSYLPGEPAEKCLDQWIRDNARRVGLEPHRIKAAMQTPLSITPQECRSFALLLEVESVWLTHQVMAALYPEQVEMLLNPARWQGRESVGPSSEVALATVPVTLTAAMIEHGYLDLPSSAKALFPADAIAGRSREDVGGQVELRYGSHLAMTDVRIKSEHTISPRKRFTGWLKSELRAKVGDTIRIDRLSERTFRLTHIPA
jgi:hypothetical protein